MLSSARKLHPMRLASFVLPSRHLTHSFLSCTTDAQFVPLTAANLILLGVAKNSDNITLSPDWVLISGLLVGVAFMVFG